jgi:hypothetical protein
MPPYSLRPFISEPAETYRSKRTDFLTSHQLIDFARCPLLYRQRMAGLIAELRSEAYIIGSAAHTLILEGHDAFHAAYCVGGPINPNTDRPYGENTQKFRDWAREQGKPAVSNEQYLLLCQLCTAVKGHAIAADLLAEGLAEGVLRAEYKTVQCQARLDWFSSRHGIVDLKTCDNLDDFEGANLPAYCNEFGNGLALVRNSQPIYTRLPGDAQRYGYIRQMAFYRAIYWLLTGEAVPVHLIAVEKHEPYRCGVWLIDSAALAAAQRDNERAMDALIVSRRDNVWLTHYEELRTLAA